MSHNFLADIGQDSISIASMTARSTGQSPRYHQSSLSRMASIAHQLKRGEYESAIEERVKVSMLSATGKLHQNMNKGDSQLHQSQRKNLYKWPLKASSRRNGGHNPRSKSALQIAMVILDNEDKALIIWKKRSRTGHSYGWVKQNHPTAFTFSPVSKQSCKDGLLQTLSRSLEYGDLSPLYQVLLLTNT
jgi:hypothetical protein